MEEKKVTNSKVIVVQFVNDAEEETRYFNAYDEYHCGDFVVVETAGGLYVGEVVRTDVSDDIITGYEVIDRVDTTGWRTRQKARNQRAEIKKTIEAKIASRKDEALYKLMAKDDPEIAAMLKQYLALGEIL